MKMIFLVLPALILFSGSLTAQPNSLPVNVHKSVSGNTANSSVQCLRFKSINRERHCSCVICKQRFFTREIESVCV
jgi:hypothetical protein